MAQLLARSTYIHTYISLHTYGMYISLVGGSVGGWECMLGGESLEDGSTVSKKYVCTYITYGAYISHVAIYVPMHLYTYVCTYIEVRTYEHSIQYVCTYISHVEIYWYICIHIIMCTYDQVSSAYLCIYVSCMCHVLASV